MAFSSGYWVELDSVRFEENSDKTWIQAFPVGTYNHPLHGSMTVDNALVSQFADNVNNNVRSQQLDIDYDHKAKRSDAAGWVAKAEARADGLWLLVEWTKEAAGKIKDKAYRYFSPEFVDEWVHPKTNVLHKNVLFGGGITNRPFLKDILPINMEEVFANASKPTTASKEGKLMDLVQLQAEVKKLSEQFGIPEGTDEGQTFTVIATKFAEAQALVKKFTDEKQLADKKPDALEEIKKLSEENPAIKILMETADAQAKKLAEYDVRLRAADTNATVKRLSDLAATKNFVIPPATIESLTKMLNDTPAEQSEVAVKAFESMIDAQLVQLGEKGRAPQGSVEIDSETNLNKAARKYMEDHKTVTYSEAILAVSAENPDLGNDYLIETSQGGK